MIMQILITVDPYQCLNHVITDLEISRSNPRQNATWTNGHISL